MDIYEDTLEQIIKYRTGFELLSRKYEVNFYFVDKSNVFRLLDFKVDEKELIVEIWSIRDIKDGEELFINYGQEYWVW